MKLIFCSLCAAAFAAAATNSAAERYFSIPEYYQQLARSSPTNKTAFNAFSNTLAEFLVPQEWEDIRRSILPRGGAYPAGAFSHLHVTKRVLTNTYTSNGMDVFVYQAHRVQEYDNFPFAVWDNKVQLDDISDFLQQFRITNVSVESISNRFKPGVPLTLTIASIIEFTISCRTAASNTMIVSVRERPLGAALAVSEGKRNAAGIR